MTKMARILVVDDEAAMREALHDWLKEDGYEKKLGCNFAGSENAGHGRARNLETA